MGVFDTCMVNPLRGFFDSRNNEPFIYVNTPEGDIFWSTTSFAAEVGVDMACILLDGSYLIQAEDVSDLPECFSEIGGYLYDGGHPDTTTRCVRLSQCDP